MSFRNNFTGFWNIWKDGIIQRDYTLLDEIHPGRIRSVEQWLRQEQEAGSEKGGLWERLQPENMRNLPPVLKLSEDRRKGIL